MTQRHVIAWGGYDENKPRVRLLLDALRKRGALAAEINIGVWQAIEDKSVAGAGRIVRAMTRLLVSYPGALIKLARRPSSSAVLLPYPGIPDIFVVALIAAIRRQPIVLDAFIPLHDTIVGDRALVRAKGIVARLIWTVERIALMLADIILVDTDQHGDFFAREFGIARDRFVTVLVGAEPLFGEPARPAEFPTVPTDRPLVLFYGQLIPLHGLTTILEASRLAHDAPFHWVIVGRGQEESILRAALQESGRGNVTWIPWVEYDALPALIDRAAVCLGVFGASEKAARVIPNKIFQALSRGKPVVTRESPAIAPLASRFPDAVVTVPAVNAVSLFEAIRTVLASLQRFRPIPPAVLDTLGPSGGVDELLRRLAGR